MKMKTILSSLRQRLGIPGVVQKAAAPWNTFAGTVGTTGARLVQPYEHSAFVQAAVRMIAQPISAIPLRFYQTRGPGQGRGGNGQIPINQGPLVDFWARPGGDGMDAQDFWEATIGWLQLQGEAFWIGDDSWLLSTVSQRNPLVLARPDRMRPLMEKNVLQGWELTDASGNGHALTTDQVIHLKFWNPYHPVRGLAPYLAAALAAEADWLGSKFIRALMENNGDTGQFLIAKGAPPTDDQRTQIVRALREKKDLALRGIFKPMFLTGDIAVENAQIQAADANLVATRQLLRDEIAIAFGIPPSRFQARQSYSIGSASDRYLLIEETCMPLSVKLAGAVERLSERVPSWRPPWNRRIYAAFDWSEHSTMQAARRERFEAMEKLWTKGVPLRTCSEVLDLGLPPTPRGPRGDHLGYLPITVAPVPAYAPEGPLPPIDFSQPTDWTELEASFHSAFRNRPTRSLSSNSTR